MKGNPRVTRIQIVPPMEMNKQGIFLGVDPGTKNLGIAVLHTCNVVPECELFQVKLDRSDDPITRVIGIHQLLSRVISWLCFPMYACIEGASYADRYRQVELAEIRASAMLWCNRNGFNTKVVPPLTIRKDIFGNGKTKGRDIWKDIPPDTADALGCAYFSLWKM